MTGVAVKIVLVAALARNRVIGREGDMPWRLPSDLKHFKEVTLGSPVIMGRKTYLSIGRPLPGRANIVVSRSGFSADGVETVSSLEAAIERARDHARQSGAGQVSVIGGGEIYAQPSTSPMNSVSPKSMRKFKAIRSSPRIDSTRWQKFSLSDPVQSEKDSHPIRFAIWRRRSR